MTIPDDAPELVRLRAASAASNRAGAVRAALGGYVPLDHPNHPKRWSAARRAELAAAEAEVVRTSEELNEARDAVIMMPFPDHED